MGIADRLLAAADKWDRARRFVKSSNMVMPSDKTELSKRMMELDEAIFEAEKCADTSPEVQSALAHVYKMMMGYSL